jgi:spectrin beta
LQGHKAHIDAREDSFSDCISLGKELLARHHYASGEIKAKLAKLAGLKSDLTHKWEERWEHLQLILEVYQFARDASVAEAWIAAQEPYLKSDALGVSVLDKEGTDVMIVTPLSGEK